MSGGGFWGYPSDYATEATHQGRVERIDYDTRYNVIYLIHGHYGTASTTFEAEDGLQRKVLDPLPYFFPLNKGGATAIHQVGANATSSGKAYSINGMVSDGQGIVVQNGKKYINPKR